MLIQKKKSDKLKRQIRKEIIMQAIKQYIELQAKILTIKKIQNLNHLILKNETLPN